MEISPLSNKWENSECFLYCISEQQDHIAKECCKYSLNPPTIHWRTIGSNGLNDTNVYYRLNFNNHCNVSEPQNISYLV
jgi:hypothetical protein